MIPSGVEIYVALEPIDMRLSFDRLGGLAREQIGYDARSGALFLFFGRRRDALKILFFDGSGMAILSASTAGPSRSRNRRARRRSTWRSTTRRSRRCSTAST
jgi:transposase